MKLIQNPVEIQKKFLWIYFKSSWNFNEIPAYIIKKHQWKSIGNFNEKQLDISMIYQWKSMGYSVEMSMKYKCKSIGNPVGIQ